MNVKKLFKSQVNIENNIKKLNEEASKLAKKVNVKEVMFHPRGITTPNKNIIDVTKVFDKNFKKPASRTFVHFLMLNTNKFSFISDYNDEFGLVKNRRSLPDLYIITKHYYPKIRMYYFLKYVLELFSHEDYSLLKYNGSFICSYCSTVNKHVIRFSKIRNNTYFNTNNYRLFHSDNKDNLLSNEFGNKVKDLFHVFNKDIYLNHIENSISREKACNMMEKAILFNNDFKNYITND